MKLVAGTYDADTSGTFSLTINSLVNWLSYAIYCDGQLHCFYYNVMLGLVRISRKGSVKSELVKHHATQQWQY